MHINMKSIYKLALQLHTPLELGRREFTYLLGVLRLKYRISTFEKFWELEDREFEAAQEYSPMEDS